MAMIKITLLTPKAKECLQTYHQEKKTNLTRIQRVQYKILFREEQQENTFKIIAKKRSAKEYLPEIETQLRIGFEDMGACEGKDFLMEIQ